MTSAAPSSRSRFPAAPAARALYAGAQGALAGVFAGTAIGAWTARLHGDDHLRWAWTALGRLLPLAARYGSVGLGITTAAAVVVLLARRVGRKLELAAAAAVAVLLLWGAWSIRGAWRAGLFPLEHASTPRLTQLVISFVVLCWVGPMALRVLDAISGDRPAPDRLGRVASGVFLVTWAAVVALAASFPALGAMRARGKPPVIVVSLDTLRADRLGFLGNTRNLTPKLDALAAEGVVFERATSAAPWTLASHASLFTSKLPFDHHARLDFQKIAPQQTMLAEEFKQAGYRTGAFTADGYVAASFGFDQGFEIYDESDDRRDDALPRTLGVALSWIRKMKNEPFFAFVHTYEVHSPYTHPDRADPAKRGRLGDRFTNVEIEAIRAGQLSLTIDEREWVKGLYDGDVAYMDRLMGEFLETLKREGILDRAILVIVSDHGDDLWDHSVERSPGHGHSLYQELLHVPVFVRWPGKVAAQARIKGLVSLLDVAPTLLDLAGLPRDAQHRGRDLAATWRTGTEPDAAAVTAESTEYGPDRFAILDGRYKVVFTPWPDEKNMGVGLKVAPLEVFDLEADPAETTDLSSRLAELPHHVLEMVEKVRERATSKRPMPLDESAQAPTETPSQELLDKLRSLGYVK